MKMIATSGAAPITAYPQYLHNCLRNRCEPPWSAPLPELPVLQLYVEFGAYKPVMYSIYLQDLCDLDHSEQIFPANYVVGQTPTGKWYGVFKYFHPLLVNATTFTAWLDVFVDAPGGLQEQTYFTEQMVIEPCQQLTKIKACQPAGATTTGFDINGLYYGLPVNLDYLGNNEVRYFHIAYVRMGHVKMLPPKATFSSSLFRTFRSEIEQTWQLQSELVPQWYSLVLLAIYSRGAISVNDGDTRLVKELAYEGINDDDLTWKAYANLTETSRLYFGCDDSVCVECCSPVLRSAVVGSHESASDASSSGDTFNNVLILDFDECWPTPAKGYQVQYRPIGGGAFRTWPVNFTHSPATIFTDADPAGTSYEGILRGDCGNGMFGVDVHFTAHNPESPSGSSEGSSSGASSASTPETCGRYLYHNSTDTEQDIVPADCSNTGTVATSPGQYTVVCVPETSAGVPTTPLPPGDVTYEGPCSPSDGFPELIGEGSDSGSACAAPVVVRYADSAFVTTGVTLYTDPGMTTPITASVIRVDDGFGGGNLFNVSGGVVGSSAGSC